MKTTHFRKLFLGNTKLLAFLAQDLAKSKADVFHATPILWPQHP